MLIFITLSNVCDRNIAFYEFAQAVPAQNKDEINEIYIPYYYALL